MHYRICIIGIPRCGSQYAVELIKHNVKHNFFDLVEPYTHSLPQLNIDENKQLFIEPTHFDINSHEERIKYTSRMLKEGDQNQPLIMRLFLVYEIEKMLFDVISDVQNCNFQFVILRRKNIEHQILSMGIADARNQYTLFHHDKYPTEPVMVTNYKLMSWLYRNHLMFEQRVTENDIEGIPLTYETAVEDLAKVLDQPINICLPIKKQIVTDPYDQIINKDEVKKFIQSLIK